MDLLEALESTEKKVRHLLKTMPETRDDDDLLLSRFLELFELIDSAPRDIHDTILFAKIGTQFKTIERTRRKLQEKNPELRGSKWESRHETERAYEQYALDLIFN